MATNIRPRTSPGAPKPRVDWAHLAWRGGAAVPTVWPDGTWIESEHLTYPSGGYHRRAYARCPDGRRRVFRAAVADTYFSIPARGRIAGRYVSGFLSARDDDGVAGLVFTQTSKGGGS